MRANLRRLFWLGLIWIGFTSTLQAFYDPAIGRWVNRDPIGELGELGNANVHRFARNEPISTVDPFGLASLSTPQGQCALIAALGPEAAAEILGISVATAIAIQRGQCPVDRNCMSRQGERGHTHTGGNDNPYKHCRDHPSKPNKIICKDPQDGKWIEKSKPPNWDEIKKKK